MSLPHQLNLLEATGLICLAQHQPEVEYLFRHALVQEAAYQSLVKIDRRMLHQAVGQALEQLHPAARHSRELAPLLARHFAEAGDAARALDFASQAGRLAAEVYANAEAAHHFGQALALAQACGAGAPTLADLFLRRGRALEHSAQDAAAIANYIEMEQWAQAAGDQPAQLAALTARAATYVKPTIEQDLPSAFALSQQALALARALDDRPAEAKVLWILLQYFLAQGKNAEALDHGERALAAARALGLRELEAYVLTDLLKAYFQTEQAAKSRAALAAAQDLWRELGVRNMLADTLATGGMLQVMSGNYAQALANAAEADEVSRAIGSLWNQAYARYLIDLAHFERGDIDQAVAMAETAWQLSAQAGFAEGLNQASFDLALITAYMGALPRAFETIRRLLGAETLPGALPARPQFEALLALLHCLAGRPADAQAALDQSESGRDPAVLKSQFILTQFIFAQVKIELALARGDHAQALQLAEEITQALRVSGVVLFRPDARLLQGRALRAAGRLEEAQAALEAGRARAEDLGARRILWPILAELADLAGERGDAPTAAALRQQAAEHIAYIAAHAGDETLAESFRRRHAVQAVLGQVESGLHHDDTKK